MNESATGFAGAIVIAFGALVPLVNPPGLAPIFLSMTRGVSDAARTTIASRIARTSFLLLLGAMLVGSYVLILFGPGPRPPRGGRTRAASTVVNTLCRA